MTDVFTAAEGQQPAENDLTVWVGEGKKYATAEDALKALPHSQAHIAKLEEENLKLRTQVGTLEVQVEEPKPDANAAILAEVRKLSAQQVQQVATPPVDETALQSLVDNRITEHSAQQTAAQNRATAQAAMVELFGTQEKATEALRAKAQELKVTPAYLTGLSETSPAILVSQFTKAEEVLNPKPNPTPTVVNGVPDTEVITPGTKRYYDKMRRDDPAKFHSAEILAERSRNLTEKGQAFYQ